MAPGSPDQPAPDGGVPEERYGILTLARFRKDDGRSLILYSHDEDGADVDEAAARALGDGGERAGAHSARTSGAARRSSTPSAARTARSSPRASPARWTRRTQEARRRRSPA